jgi:NAD(P)-dependent dehydrogenase (short-subunit alcohol dehydrogenase family)
MDLSNNEQELDTMQDTNRTLAGRTVVITGAGRGLGREYALLAAARGASIVINDLAPADDGSPAAEVVETITAAGGQAVAHSGDIATSAGADGLLETALSAFGGVDVVVNNAGVLRDRMLVNMSDDEWDSIMTVHLRGHFCVTRAFATYWRTEAKEGRRGDRVLVCTSSISGLKGVVGQVNYATAKAGLATFAQLCHRELHDNYGVRCYALAPGARTRLTMSTPHAARTVGREVGEGEFDYWSPANVAPVVAWLAAADCGAPSGSVLGVEGDTLEVFQGWHVTGKAVAGRTWTPEDFQRLEPWFAKAAAGSEPAPAQQIGEILEGRP